VPGFGTLERWADGAFHVPGARVWNAGTLERRSVPRSRCQGLERWNAGTTERSTFQVLGFGTLERCVMAQSAISPHGGSRLPWPLSFPLSRYKGRKGEGNTPSLLRH
jgi:hypothetical protein